MRGDGTIQISADHCPGVNLLDSEMTDEEYIMREILLPLQEDPKFISTLREQILAVKRDSYSLTPDGAIQLEWSARDILWSRLFGLVRRDLGASYSPRDALEVLKVDLVPFIEQILVNEFHNSTINGKSIERFFSDNQFSIDAVAEASKKKQIDHRIRLQNQGTIFSASETLNHDEQIVTFHRRIGESFSVNSKDLLKMRELEHDAISLELDYLVEVVGREFVYGGVVINPLTLQQEIGLMFYLADAIELMANAFAILEESESVSVKLINQAICEVDATILNTVRALGGIAHYVTK